jgi:ABC-type lipoprotein release transport system permease subunit
MKLIFKIAWRNVQRHKGKSIIIGVILFLGALIMTVGNGVISGMDNGLQKNIVNSFTGDIVLISAEQESDNVLFEFMGKATEPINNFVEVKKFLGRQSFIDKFLPAGKNMALVLNDDGSPGYSYLLGVDFEKYLKMFPNNLTIMEGRLLNTGEHGVIVPTGSRQQLYDFTGKWLKPEGDTLVPGNLPSGVNPKSVISCDSVVLMGYSNDNTMSDIRLGIKGIVKYRALNTIWGHFPLTDIESYRKCLGYFAASEKTAELTGEDKQLLGLGNDNLDNLFSNNDLMVENTRKIPERKIEKTAVIAAEPQQFDIDAGAYNLVFVKLKKGVKINEALKQLNTSLKKENLGVRAVSWKKAIGSIGSMAVMIKGSLFVFVMFLFFVAIIIIVNTLSMAAIERTSEIGMMRAVGARKGFIRSMFFAETGILSFVFGGAGIIAGIIMIRILSILHFTTTNDMVQLLYGGDTFNPLCTIGDLGLAILQLLLVTLIAVTYPLKVAGGIKPLDAISRE